MSTEAREIKTSERLILSKQAHELISGGMSARNAAEILGVPHSSVCRHLVAYRAYLATGDLTALAPGKSSGRPPLVRVSEEDARAIRALMLRTNRGRCATSMVAACRAYAATDACPEDLRQAILAPRSSKHALPSALRKALRIGRAVIEHHRSPKTAALNGAYAPGRMRVVEEIGEDGFTRVRRLIAGERQSWDDASINFICYVDWPLGGCKCSEKFGVKVGRFQLLAGIDDASDFCPGFSFVVRPSQGYRGEDVVAAMARTWAGDVQPGEVIVEKGVWQSRRAQDFYRAVGVKPEVSNSPHTKLVENFWNRLWTHLSQIAHGQIGRYRGEEEEATQALMRCHAGRLDPRKVFMSLSDTLDAIEAAIAHNNATPVEGATGTWVPQERYRSDLEKYPREALTSLDRLTFLWAPEQRELTVRQGGMVGCQIDSPLGPKMPYHFATPELTDYEGAKVRVCFDPHREDSSATVVLDATFLGEKAGTIIARNVPLISDPARIWRVTAGWATGVLPNPAGIEARKLYSKALRENHRSIAGSGIRKSSFSRATDGAGLTNEIEVRGTSNAIARMPRTEFSGEENQRGGEATTRRAASRRTVDSDSEALAARLAADPRRAEYLKWKEENFS